MSTVVHLPSRNDSSEQGQEIAVTADMAEVVDAAQDALLQTGGIYQRAGQLVRVTYDPSSKPRWLQRPPRAPVLEAYSVEALREQMAKAATWRRGERKVLPPRWAADTLLARGAWPFPVLESVSDCPVLRPDGSIFDRNGYDAETGVLVSLDRGMAELSGQIPAEPSREVAQAALQVLADPFQDFPFREASDRAAALAIPLTLIARPLVPGPVPMFGARAPTPGSGKTLLGDTGSVIVTGRTLPRLSPGRSAGEEAKRILALALEGTSAVLLDNVEHVFGSAPLAAALTGAEVQDRLLGVNRTVTAPLRAVWVATGNNLSVKGDLARRIIPIDLDAGVELPEERQGFRYPDLLAHVRGQRPALLAAALTVLRAFLQHQPEVDLSAFGSFEAWSSTVRACLVWLGEGDPCGGRARIREEGDPERDQLGALLSVWHEVFGDQPITCREILDRDHIELKDALPRPRGKEPSTASLGYYLRRYRDRIVAGLKLEAAGEDRKRTQRWHVTRCR